jgi:hypothetical protein
MPKRATSPQDTADPQEATAPAETDTPQVDDRRRIAQRAYERFQMRGGEPGRDQEDWFEAERELNEST